MNNTFLVDNIHTWASKCLMFCIQALICDNNITSCYHCHIIISYHVDLDKDRGKIIQTHQMQTSLCTVQQ